MFATELQKKLDIHNIKILSLAAHPGWSATNLQTKGAELEQARVAKKLNELANKYLEFLQRIIYFCNPFLPRGVTGNTSDSGSEESRFEPWRGNYTKAIAKKSVK